MSLVFINNQVLRISSALTRRVQNPPRLRNFFALEQEEPSQSPAAPLVAPPPPRDFPAAPMQLKLGMIERTLEAGLQNWDGKTMIQKEAAARYDAAYGPRVSRAIISFSQNRFKTATSSVHCRKGFTYLRVRDHGKGSNRASIFLDLCFRA